MVTFTAILLCFLSLHTVFAIISFEIVNYKITIPSEWIKNYEISCGTYNYYKSMQYKCFSDCGVIFATFGIPFFIFITKNFSNG